MRNPERNLTTYKSLAIAIGLTVLFLPVMLFSITQIVRQGESELIRRETELAKNILQRDLTNMDRMLLEWASWDETKNFVLGLDSGYLDRNLDLAGFSNLDIDIFIVLDGNNNEIFSTYHDQDLQKTLPMPFNLADLQKAYPSLTRPSDPMAPVNGELVVDQRPMLAASRPILNSQGTGLASGRLIFIKLLDVVEADELSSFLLRPMQVFAVGKADHTDLPTAAELAGAVHEHILSQGASVGYLYMDDLNGQPTLILKTETPRFLNEAGSQVAQISIAMTLLLSVILFFGSGTLLRRLDSERSSGIRNLERFQAIFQHSNEAVVLVTPDYTILDANPAFTRLLSWHAEPNQPANLTDLVSFQPGLEQEFLAEASQLGNVELFHGTRYDNYQIDLEIIVSSFQDQGARVYCLTMQDVTGRMQLEEQLNFDAIHDSLTGLGNRTLMLEHLRSVNERKKRTPAMVFALFSLDFDHFNKINDVYGNQAGDQVLIEIARRLEDGLRSADKISRFEAGKTLARLSEDEFIILLEDVGSAEYANQVVERIIDYVTLPFQVGKAEIKLTASAGLTIPAQPYDDPADILRDAAIALNVAKLEGRNRVVTFEPAMRQGAMTRLQLENDLRHAFENREFEVYYQPVYDLQRQKLHGFEALVRWNSPQRGLVLPGKFINIAEETGLVVPLGYLVLEQACGQMHAWQSSLPNSQGLTVNVNFSARQIILGDLVERVRATLASSGLDPHCLCIEVTENVLVQMGPRLMKQIEELRSLGIRIQIDDFGTGYSSFSYLRSMPVDGFKIDRSFVQDLPAHGSEIVKTLIQLGQNLGLSVVAEGIETTDQRDCLQQLGCQYIQGFLLAKPMPAGIVTLHLSETQPDWNSL